MAFKRLALILGNCLFPNHNGLNPGPETLFMMAEDFGLCTHFRYHKHKLVLFLSAMRSHARWIRKQWPLVYYEIGGQSTDMSYESKVRTTLKQHPDINEICTYTIEDYFFFKRLKQLCQELKIRLTICPSPGFLTCESEFRRYLASSKKPLMHSFYISQRRRLKILLDSTVAVGLGMPFHTSVASAKGAIEGLTRALAAELAPGIRVNCIAPSIVQTPLAHRILATPDKIAASAACHPLKRVGRDTDIAEMVCFLLSDRASWITGQIVGVDGGLSATKN